ncbi:metalloregulator ArsR/SmtB family transcription factor [Tropicibacter sp. R15_0]|uniref:ArsR/SmtB family transcription factor n=1 Tax=Tropicibacter sp. R15_0 TaxID=2821101 RepID=UPI00256FCB95|nr:metalloregulator ArsR/SmtB family transcription factor [Tropicibacter sp. R15_0]
MMEATGAATMFHALSNTDRLAVLRALVAAGPDGLSAGEIAERVGASPSRASFHLSALSDAGCVTRERQARSQRYRVDFERMGQLLAYLLEDCCGGNEQVRNCCVADKSCC